MQEHTEEFAKAVKEQLFSGLDGEGNSLTPGYLEDPYFDAVKWFHWEDDKLYHGAAGYLEWKKDITPPMRGQIIGYPARNADTPNLYIDGTFYGSIEVENTVDGVEIFTTSDTGAEIEDKYGSQIFGIAGLGKSWFNENFMLPAIANFFKNCGYR